MTTPVLAGNMTEEQRALFYAQMTVVQKDEVVGVLLALFLGTFGAHHFYLRRPGLGALYCIFFWSGVPTIAGFIECFFMPGRVRQFNAEQAMLLAANIRYAVPGTGMAMAGRCGSCGAPLADGVNFCSRCGMAVVH